MKLPISLGDKSGDETDYRDQLLVNYTLVARDIKGDQGYVLSHAGLTAFGNGEGIDRGGIWNSRQDSHLRISGTNLISVDEDGVTTTIGSIPGTLQTSLPYSFQTQGIVSDTRFWLYDGDTLSEVTDSDLGAPIDCDWINGVYFFTDGETIYHTRADDESAIDPLTFATSEFSPDRTLGVLKNNQNQMVVFNRYSTEWFRDGGGENFRFRRLEGKAIKLGIVGTHCKVEAAGRIFVLGNRKIESPSIHYITGGSTTPIATREVDIILEGYSEIELAQTVLETRGKKKDIFIIVRLLRDTLLFNKKIADQYGLKYAWTILKTDIEGDDPWRARNGVLDPRINQWIYGDSLDDRLGLLDDTTNLQYGNQVEEIFYTPIVEGLETQSIDELEIETIPGHVTADVNMWFSFSYNGVSYGTEHAIPVSRANNFGIRYLARNLGYISHNFNIKFRKVSDGRQAFSGLRIEHS